MSVGTKVNLNSLTAKIWHVTKDCQFNINEQAAKFTEEKSEENLFLACQTTSTRNGDIWYLDSDCTNHTTSDDRIFTNINSSVKSQIRMGNGAVVQENSKRDNCQGCPPCT